MPLLYKVLALHVPDQELRIGGANVDCAASVDAPVISGAASRAPCFVRSRRSRTVHSERCRRALRLHRNRARLIAQVWMDEQATHQSTACLCRYRQSRGRSERSDRQSHCVEHFRWFDEAMGSASHSTVDGKIKAARCGAVGWRKSAERSGTSHNVRTDTTVCLFAQVPGKSTLRAHCVHPCHDPRR
jgi:hypothetical protein